MGLAVRENLGVPDAGIVNTPETRRLVTRVLRRLRPTIVIAPAQQGRHPDHRVTSELVRDACFISGLAKVEPDLPKHRPRKVLHCLSYREDHTRPTFVVDISAEFDRKLNHPENGMMNLHQMLALYSWHGKHHVAHITALKERSGWA